MGRLNLSGLLLLRGEGLCRTNIEIMFNTLLNNVRCKSSNHGKGKKKKKYTKKSEQLCGKKKTQNIAGVTIQHLQKINVPLKWCSKGKGKYT